MVTVAMAVPDNRAKQAGRYRPRSRIGPEKVATESQPGKPPESPMLAPYPGRTVAASPNDDWTENFQTAVKWLRSGQKKTIRAG
jgi:hypothetical protein